MAVYNLNVSLTAPISVTTQNVSAGDVINVTCVPVGQNNGSPIVSFSTPSNCSVTPASDLTSPYEFTVTGFTNGTTYNFFPSFTDNDTNTTIYGNSISGTVASATVPPDTSVTVTTSTTGRLISSTATSATLNFGSATPGHTYRLRLYDGGANNGTSIGVATANSSGNFAFSIPSTRLPTNQGATQWYSLYAANPIDGDGLYDYVTATVNQTYISRRLASPTLTVSDNDAASSSVGIVQNITNNATVAPSSVILRQYKNGSLLGSQQNVTWTGNGAYSGYFTQPRNTGSDTYFYNAYLQYNGTGSTPTSRVTTYSFSVSRPSSLNYQPGYLLPDLGVVGTPTTPISSTATSATVTVSGMARSTDTVAVRTVNGSTNLGSRNGNGTITWSSSLPSAGSSTTYELFTRRATSTGGDGTTFYDTNDQFTVSRTAGETGSITGGTTATEGDSGLAFSFAITNASTGTYNWQITRNSGTVESGGEISSATTGTFTGSSGSTTVTWVNNTIVETGFQGESFTITLRTGGTVGSGTTLDTHNFTLYDNDAGITANNVIIEPYVTAHTASLVVASGGGSISARIKDSGGTVRKTFTLISSGVDTEAVADVPSGNSETYSVEVYNGLAWIAADTYSVTKRTYSVNAPTSINEGSGGTVTVSTTNFGTGTLYWSVAPSGDFGTPTGTVSISSNSGGFTVTPTADTLTEGAETGTISLYRESSRTNLLSTDTFTINDTSTGTFFSLSPPASINEGSSGVVTVTTGGFGSGTLYWDVEPASDFGTSSGPVTITSDSGSFSVSPAEDSLTEGAETATVYLYTNSARTNQVASNTFTINDTSTGTTAPYGLEVFNSSGTKVIAITDRISRFVLNGSITVAANSTSSNITVSGMQNNDSWNVFVTNANEGFFGFSTNKYTGYFTITNNDSTSQLFDYWVLRS